MSYLESIAETLGFLLLGGTSILFLLALAGAIHDYIRMRIPAYDLSRYDENRRWNRKQGKQMDPIITLSIIAVLALALGALLFWLGRLL